MNKARKIAFLILGAALALSVLSACGSKAEPEPEFEGAWVLECIEAEHEGVAMSAEEVDVFERALGAAATLQLAESGSAKITTFGEVMTGTWERLDATNATLVVTNYGDAANSEIENGNEMPDDQKIEGVTMHIEGQRLTIDLGSEKLVFITQAAHEEEKAAE